MYWRIFLNLFLALGVMGQVHGGSHPGRSVSLDWVVRAQLALEKGTPVENLVREFARTHRDPDVFPIKPSDWTDPYLNLVPVDLDGDGVQEQILFISGAYKDRTRLFALRKCHDRWEVAFTRQAWAHNEPPPYEILDCEAGSHAFRFVHMEAHGTGIWQYTNIILHSFGGSIIPGLEFVEEHNLALLGFDLNGNAHASKITTTGADLRVSYTYEFYGGFSLLERLKLDASSTTDNSVLTKGTAEATYRWEPRTRKYRLTSSPLTEDQIRCFTHLYNEALFRQAFHKELKALASDGTLTQRRLARHFLQPSASSASKTRPMRVRTAIVGTAGYDPEFVKFWSAWIGKHEVITERRIKGTRLFTLRDKSYAAFIVDGPCGVPCYQERCLIFDRTTGKQVGEFITKELLPAVGSSDPDAEDQWRERRVDWKKGVIVDLMDRKALPMTLDRLEGFFPDGQPRAQEE